MAAYGLLIDYEYCTNCGSCQVTCKEEHGYPVGKTGIKVLSDGPWKIDGKRWNWNHFPVLTDLCDLCAEYGTVEELSKKLDRKPKQFLMVPQYNPLEAKGAFVPSRKSAHRAAHIEVQGTGKASYAVHRHDTKVGEIDETAVLEGEQPTSACE